MKHLKKHPKQQRMEDMTFPITKMGKKMNKIIAKELDKKDVDISELGSELTLAKLEEQFKEAFFAGLDNQDKKDKVVWEGREWLRSINDDRHGWHVLAWVILGVAIIISLFILW